MYYVIVPLELCERRRVFLQNLRIEDGRVVVTMRDLGKISFSLGPVEIVNDDDLARLHPTLPTNDGDDVGEGGEAVDNVTNEMEE